MPAVYRYIPCLALVFSGQLIAQDTVQDWMDRMALAVEQTNYQGTFVRTHQGKMEALEIFHRVDPSGEIRERLIALDGAQREILRDSQQVKCVFPDRRSVFVETADPGMSLLPGIPRVSSGLGNYLVVDCDQCTEQDIADVESSGCEGCVAAARAGLRMLSMDTVVLAVSPKDAYRYGYRLWLDRKSALPLQTQVLDEQGEIIEQIRFTHLDIGKPVPLSSVQSGIDTDKFEWFFKAGGDPVNKQDAGWRADNLPPGFALASISTDGQKPGSEQEKHLVFSDGLASISVFVAPGERLDLAPGLSRLGGTNAFTVQIAGHTVTAMGEVPPAAVEMLARSMLPANSGDQ
jgi:sigma-E factor negative regulatory protein RseB